MIYRYEKTIKGTVIAESYFILTILTMKILHVLKAYTMAHKMRCFLLFAHTLEKYFISKIRANIKKPW